jgi:signal peptidase II
MKTKYLILLSMAGAIICLDQWTKLLVLDHFVRGESIPVIPGYFNLTYVQNPGAAFGFLAGAPESFRVPFFIMTPIVALVVIFYLYRHLREDQKLQATALALILGGAVGNFIDRVRFHYVVDFLDFHWKGQMHFPAFNVADSAITVGVVFLMIALFFETKEEMAQEKNRKEAVENKST